MVFRAQGKFARGAPNGAGKGASDGWASDIALEILRSGASPSGQLPYDPSKKKQHEDAPRLHCQKRMLEIRFEIRGVFEADAETDDSVAVIGAVRAMSEIEGHGEAGDAGPTKANLEQFERVDKRVNTLLGELFFENEGEHAGRTSEIAFEKLVTGAGRKSGMKNEFDFGTPGEPLCEAERGFFDGGKADPQRL